MSIKTFNAKEARELTNICINSDIFKDIKNNAMRGLDSLIVTSKQPIDADYFTELGYAVNSSYIIKDKEYTTKISW